MHKPMNEIVQSVFRVLSMKSTNNLDGVNDQLMQAIAQLFLPENVNYVAKQNYTRVLVQQFEPYLKKIYYLQNGCEVVASHLGWDPAMKDTLRSHPCLWNLKKTYTDNSQRLYRTLTAVVEKRNLYSHNSPILSDPQLDKCIRNTMVMYFYVTGATIDGIERNMVEDCHQVADDTERKF